MGRKSVAGTGSCERAYYVKGAGAGMAVTFLLVP